MLGAGTSTTANASAMRCAKVLRAVEAESYQQFFDYEVPSSSCQAQLKLCAAVHFMECKASFGFGLLFFAWAFK